MATENTLRKQESKAHSHPKLIMVGRPNPYNNARAIRRMEGRKKRNTRGAFGSQ